MGYNFDKAQMKKVVLLLAVAGLLGVSCSKKVAAPQGETEVIVPCSGPEYRTNNKYIRASAVGLSGDINMAKKKALTEVSAQLASSMNQLVERVAINYGNSYQVGENEEAKSKFEDMAKIVVKEKLRLENYLRKDHAYKRWQVQSLYCGRVGRRRAYGRYQQQGFQVDKQRYQVEN